MFELRQIQEDPAWFLEQDGFDPSREREMETLFAIGNGRLGLRGTSDFPVPAAQPDLLIAGVYDKQADVLPHADLKLPTKTGRVGTETEIVPFPSPLQWLLEVDDLKYRSDSPELIDHRRTLDFKSATYEESNEFEDQQGRRTRVRTSRLASLFESDLLIQRIEILAKNYSAKIKLSFPMKSREFEGIYPHLIIVEEGEAREAIDLLAYRTHGSNVRIVFAQKIYLGNEVLSGKETVLVVSPGETIQLLRFVSVSTDRDVPDPRERAVELVAACTPSSLGPQTHDHSARWAEYWERADLNIGNAPALSQAERFNLYHLRIAATNDSRVSVPAKTLTGRAYEGHVFWDTEIFMFPFYLYTEPEIAKSLLLYRYQTLDGAKFHAAELGYKGACYAWESTLSGKDMTPKAIVMPGTQKEVPVHTGVLQIHVTADIAYAVWRYWDATLDHEFMLNYGAEILIETARYWMSRATLRGQSLHVENVVGPDEYHIGIHDNTFTNWMARFNLETASKALAWMEANHQERFRDLTQRVGLREDEAGSWANHAARFYIPSPDKNKRIEQFRGFFNLKYVKVPEYERHNPPVSRVLNWEQINQMQLLKQADVLMIPFLFPNAYSPDVIKANYQYYEPITDHGSSLSPCVHAAIAARAGLKDEALKYWKNSLFIDLLNSMTSTELGIHAAAIGGTWQALVFHMMGITFEENGIRHATTSQLVLPKECRDIKMKLTYRGKTYPIEIRRKRRSAS